MVSRRIDLWHIGDSDDDTILMIMLMMVVICRWVAINYFSIDLWNLTRASE
jgi:hypothetical protein